MSEAGAARCAVYTRKSSEEGLDQAFNSLQAQREACEAYIRSQVGEGWRLVPAPYDDGGWSGGSMDRPALRRLLADIRAGRIDIIVVYKVDRLTRSLADFAKIVETLDSYGASFVSVTQPFNTTTSMGRLTLNVLLSFAQFEREVTGERIRDKIAASKARGMWMGGVPPLGYDPPTDQFTRALRVNEAEAATVRLIFAEYLCLGSVHVLQRRLLARGVRSKHWISARGREVGGAAFSRGALFHLLRNRTYLGEITHKDKSYPGAHPAIVEAETFEAAQCKLSVMRERRRGRPRRADSALLTGLLYDADGHPMSPTFTPKGGRLYRYYVSAPLQQGQILEATEAIRRVPQGDADALVQEITERVCARTFDERDRGQLRTQLERVEIHAHSVQIVFARKTLFMRRSDPRQELAVIERRLAPGETVAQDIADRDSLRVTILTRLRLRGGRSWLLSPDGRRLSEAPRVDPVLVEALRSAHAKLAALSGAPLGLIEASQPARGPSSYYESRLLCLAFLAPQLQRDILDGMQPPGLTLEQLIKAEIPTSWARQVERFS